MNTTLCPECGDEYGIGQFPFCSGKGSHSKGTGVVVEDSIPGGYLVEHGLCNPDGSPRRYYSKSEMRREADKRGLVNAVRHIDGSPHTVRWV